MYKPLPNCLTIKESPIEGLGLYAKTNLKGNSFIGLTHIQNNNFEFWMKKKGCSIKFFVASR